MITADTKSFTDGLKGWATRFGVSNDKAVRNVATRMFEAVIRRTPVNTGWARANWYPSINRRLTMTPGGAPDGGGSYSAPEVASVVATGKAGDLFLLQNGVPYIGALENGSSQQAPEGMVKLTIAETATFFKQYAKGGRR